MDKILNVRIGHVNHTTAEWSGITTVPFKGNLLIEWTDNNGVKLKIGDGVNTYNNLPYATSGTDLSAYYTKTQIDSLLTDLSSELGTEIDDITKLFQPTVSESNKLTTEDFVNSSINSMSANFVASNASNANFATKSALTSATTFYHSGAVYVPTKHDYAVVLKDESQSNAQTRYQNVSDTTTPSWQLQYIVNDAPFTAAQNNAINSGITSAKVTSYDSHIANKSNPHAVTKSQVGLGNVDNTSDANKPISTATSTALNLKANKTELTAYATKTYVNTNALMANDDITFNCIL